MRTRISGPRRQAPASLAGERAAKLWFRGRTERVAGGVDNALVVVPPTDTPGVSPGFCPRTGSTRAKASYPRYVGRPAVETHVENIYKKLGATKRAEAVKLAQTAGLLRHP